MTLEDIQKAILALIEELNPESEYLTDDPDIQAKINYVINQIQYELARLKKIPALETETVEENEDYDMNDLPNFYQLRLVRDVNCDIIDNIITFKEAGTAKIYYYKYPIAITEETDKTRYKFELSSDALHILPYGVAADLLKSDVASNYGQIYAQRYQELKSQLDPRYNLGAIQFDGGVSL